MGPKKGQPQQEAPPPDAVAENDPAVIAMREAMERQHQEDRKAFESSEVIARRRVEAMENVGWKCVLSEREKALNPNAWKERTTTKLPPFVYVKLLTGNRAMLQENYRVPLTPSMTFQQLKEAICREATKLSGNPKLQTLYDPSRQHLALLGKDVVCDDPFNTEIKTLNIHCGSTLHLALKTPAPHLEALPAQIS